jgi:hypothetical protein
MKSSKIIGITQFLESETFERNLITHTSPEELITIYCEQKLPFPSKFILISLNRTNFSYSHLFSKSFQDFNFLLMLKIVSNIRGDK